MTERNSNLPANSEVRVCSYAKTGKIVSLKGPLRATVSRDGVTVENSGKAGLALVGPCAAPRVSTVQGGIVTRGGFRPTEREGCVEETVILQADRPLTHGRLLFAGTSIPEFHGAPLSMMQVRSPATASHWSQALHQRLTRCRAGKGCRTARCPIGARAASAVSLNIRSISTVSSRRLFFPDCPSPIFALAHAMGATVLLRAAHAGLHSPTCGSGFSAGSIATSDRVNKSFTRDSSRPTVTLAHESP